MARLRHGHSAAVVDVREDSVDRYRAAGWVDAEAPKRQTRRKKSDEPSDDD